MKTIKKQIEVTLESGTVLHIVMSATRGYETKLEHHFCDGDEMEIEKNSPVCDNELIVSVNGMTIKCSGISTGKLVPADYRAKGIYATIDGSLNGKSVCIGLSETKYKEINTDYESVKKEAETDENWQKYLKIKERAAREAEDYERHVRAVENMMTLNGKTY